MSVQDIDSPMHRSFSSHASLTPVTSLEASWFVRFFKPRFEDVSNNYIPKEWELLNYSIRVTKPAWEIAVLLEPKY